MANTAKPDINSALTVNGGNVLTDSAEIAAQEQATAGIHNDWQEVNRGLEQLKGTPSDDFAVRAGGDDLTGAYWANRQAESQNAAPQTYADLGRALLASAKNGSLQAAQGASANTAQQQDAAKQALATQNSIAQTKQAMQAADMNLSNQKFQIWQTLNNSNNQMQLTQATLHNNYVNGLANAQNAEQAIALQQNQYNINQNLSYISAAIGAASAATAGWAASAAKGPSTNTGTMGNMNTYGSTSSAAGYDLPDTRAGA